MTRWLMLICGLAWIESGILVPVGRDASGLMTVGDLVQMGTEMCHILDGVNNTFHAPAFYLFGLNDLVMSMAVPIPRPSILFDPLGLVKLAHRVFSTLVGFLVIENAENFSNKEEFIANLSRQLTKDVADEFRKNTTTSVKSLYTDYEILQQSNDVNVDFLPGSDFFYLVPSSETNKFSVANEKDRNDGVVQDQPVLQSVFLNVSDLIQAGGAMCRRLRKWSITINSSTIAKLFGVQKLRLPLLDLKHPLNPMKILDPLELHHIPGKMVSGVTGLIANLFGKVTGDPSGEPKAKSERFRHKTEMPTRK